MSSDLLNIPIRGRKISLSVEVREVVAHVETPFQTIDIVDTDALGKILLLDGHVQLASLDERAYHEALVHIPMLSLDKPIRALVVGGGDGGVLRELVKHDSLQTIDMVEIDGGVVETAKRYLPEISNGAFEDPRVHLHIADAFPFLQEVQDPYDLLVLDITDVYEGEDGALSERLFTDEFYADCRRALKSDGLLVTQADNHIFCPYSLEGIRASLQPHFAKLGSYQALVPSFGGYSAYVWAGKDRGVSEVFPGSPFEMAYLNDTTWKLALARLPFAK